MIFQPKIRVCLFVVLCFLYSCAQIVPPQGGAKDVTAPKLMEVTPADSLLNTKVSRISLRFDEFITLNNAASEITVAPILPFPLNVSVNKKTVTVKIPDSLLMPNTTYRISFGNAIQDVHENNPFTGYHYTFSTGDYFDSLQLNGFVINAATGLRDTGAWVVLYDAVRSDSAVVREKPLYAVKTNGFGDFRLEGLPGRPFKIYALRDANSNMVYDGPGELIAFSDSVVVPAVNSLPLRLNLFAEKDSSGNIAVANENTLRTKNNLSQDQKGNEHFSYLVLVDTSDIRRRTQDITQPIRVSFNKPFQNFNERRINLSYDSAGMLIETFVHREEDTSENLLLLNTTWKENTVYTLRLLKGFAQDSAGADAMPSRYTFRTKRDEDYAKLHIHLPSKYFGAHYVFVLLKENDTMYQRPVRDTMIHFTKLQPGTYRMRVIIDKNQNGFWDTGDLLDKIQPEEVVPYNNEINLKAGWENMIDFEERHKPENGQDMSPNSRDNLRR